MSVVFDPDHDYIEIPFGYGAIQLGIAEGNKGKALMIGRVDPPVGFGNPVHDGDVKAEIVLSFKSVESVDNLINFLKYIKDNWKEEGKTEEDTK